MKKIKTRKFRLKMRAVWRLMLVLILVLIGFRTSRVDAGMFDTTLEKKRIDNVYAIAEIDGVKRIFYLNMYYLNGRVSYCIELGVDITSSRYHSTSDFSISYLTDEQIEYIRSITYFGYLYISHNDYLYYMAAQEIIWEYITGIDIYWTGEMNADGRRINIDWYKNNILREVDYYNKKIDFTYDIGQVYMVGEEIVVEDLNGTLSEYEVVSSKYSEVIINDDFLNIKVGDKIGNEKIELRRKGYYEYDSLLYYYDNSQKLISYGNYREVDKVISFEIRGVSLKGRVVEKNNSNINSTMASLEGSIYELYSEDDELVGTYKSDENGCFEVNNLEYGKYYFKQIKASLGYMIEDEKKEFIVDSDDEEVILEQGLITNRIEINKIYGNNGKYQPERGILFNIYNNDYELVMKVTTNEMGIIDIVLPFGRYKVVQKTTTSGYSKVNDFWIEVDEEKNEKINYNLVNELILVKVQISTFIKENDESIVSNNIAYKIREKCKNTYLEFDGRDVFYADDIGMVSIPGMLPYGDYILEQVSVPKGVVVLKKDVEFSINDNSKLELEDGNLVMKLNVYNDIVKGSIKVKALEEVFYKDINEYGYKNIVRGNVGFLLIANEDIILNGKVIYDSGDEIYSGQANNDGELVIDELYLGRYCLLDNDTKEKKCFVIDSADNISDVVNVDLEFVKYLDKSSIIIKNKSNDNFLIKDSIFEVIDSDDDVIYTGITNAEGIIKVDNLILGNYCIRQKKVDENYYILEDKVCFELKEERMVEVINEKIVNKVIRVPNTLEENSVGIYEVIVVLVMIGTGYLVYKKIFNSKLYR